MDKKKDKSDLNEFIETLKKLDEESKRKEEEENQKKIGEMSLGELKNLIQATIRKEALSGDLSLLNNKRKKILEKWIWVSVAILLLSFLAYRTFWFESDYLLEINENKLFVEKKKGWVVEKKEIKVVNNKWHLCSLYNGQESCSPIFTPFEAKYNDYYKFVFVGRGNVFLVKNDNSKVNVVKLIDGRWSFKNEYDDEWTDFHYMYDWYENYEPVDPR